MSSRTPDGFYVASICAAAFGGCMAVVAGPMENLGHPWETVLTRALAGLLACLSGVAAEALWNARPWAYRASLALALAYAAAVTLLTLAVEGAGGLMVAFWILFVSAWVVVPIVMYVRNRSATLFGTPRPPGPRRPSPAPPSPVVRPVARPVPPGGRQQP